MKTQFGFLRSVVSASALVLVMGFAGSASAAVLDTCTVNTTDPDAFATVTAGGALFAGCGLGDKTNEGGSLLLADWDFFGKKDDADGVSGSGDGDEGILSGWTVTGYTGANTGTWGIDADAFDADTEFLLVLKDGSGANPEGVTPDTHWVWFEISNFEGVSGGDWTMWGNGSSLKNSSHMSLYVRGGGGGGGGGVPEPATLLLLGAGLIGLGFARRRKHT